MGPRLLVVAAAALLGYLATWGLVVVVSLFNAAGGLNDGREPLALPPPNSWTLRAMYVAVAVVAGLVSFRACRDRDVSLRRAAEPAGLALAAVLVLSGSTYAVGASHEHDYLEHLPPGMSRQAGLAYGSQACDWLAGERWGRPPGADHLPGMRKVQRGGLVYQPRDVRSHQANSTVRLMVYYLEHLDARQPGPLTQNEREQASVTAVAFYELCPFQQWVHRPLGGDHGGD
ncbi:hypothetical protein [Nocardioides cynanchi]|uniref:hypothetical protein n=1 Tax=Nocardioides cynanchi TaxID=2558918 RepID=UPI001246BDDF|nr:hypothetical protein [Nocardioides cynanchi]